MKKLAIFFILLIFYCLSTTVFAAPGYQEQLALIADNAGLWKQNIDFGLWGYIVTDLDQNGRVEIISASMQGTGMYTTIDIFEVSEDGSVLNEVVQDRPEFDSAPDIMVSRVNGYYDEKADRYSYVFTDMIRNGYAESYENKRAVWLDDGVWKEIPLAFKTVLYSDPDHFTETFTDSSGTEISGEVYENAADLYFENIKPAEVCLNWQMTDEGQFSGMDRGDLLESLDASASPVCPEK